MSWTLLLTLAELVWIVIAGVVIVLQRRTATSTLAWLLALAFLPIIGLLIYWVIGPQRLARKKFKRVVSRQVVHAALAGLAEARASSPAHARLALVPMGLDQPPPLPASGITPYFDGRSAYAAILASIEAATHHVHLEYYIWEPDGIGTRLRDLLIAKARAGVQVRVVVDATGASGLRRRWRKPMLDAGVEFAWFNPITLKFWRYRRADFRSHRKIVVCDGRVGFTGGMNVADAHSAEFGERYWRDTHLGFTGPAVAPLQRAFLQDWYYASGKLPTAPEAYFPDAELGPGEADAIQLVASGPDDPAFAVHKTYFAAITAARDRLWITTPYFIPDDAITTALAVAAAGRVDVRVLVPRKGDSRVVDLAARSYFAELLAVGVKIYEYEPRFIHAKTMVVDDDLAIVATANLDNRSFRLNFELAAVVYGTDLARRLADAFVEDLTTATPVTAAALAGQRFRSRLGQASARLLSPLL
ncbi:MAG: cardiolipin synthase [Kofleriaceae bacterium]